MTKSETTQDGTVKNSRRLVRRGLWNLLWLGVLVGISGEAYAQIAKLTALDGDDEDAFGISVSLSGDRALVGSYQDDDSGASSGSAYIFRLGRTTSVWNQEAKLTATDDDANDRFGASVSLDGTRALIGANGKDDAGSASGAAYIFEYDGAAWVEQAKLTASDAGSDARFGSSVSLGGDRALIGARGDDHAGANSGAAYIFEYDGAAWVEQAKLTTSDAAPNDRFGHSVSLFEDVAVIGAYLDDDDGAASGSVYVYRFNGSAWVQEAKLTAADGDGSDRFGYSVSAFGDRILIGAIGDQAESGSAYIYRAEGTTWVEEDKIFASDAATNDNFGVSVSLFDNDALIGAWGNADAGLVTGSAYLFNRDNGWVQINKLLPDGAAAGDGFGISVSINQQGMLVGAFGDDDEGEAAGAAYVFGTVLPTAIDDAAAVPDAYRLHANYPNPFNPSTEIRFDLPKAAHATLVIYDLMGREVTRLVDRPLPAGTHAVTWQAEGLSSGTYIYRLTAGAYSQARSMVLFR